MGLMEKRVPRFKMSLSKVAGAGVLLGEGSERVQGLLERRELSVAAARTIGAAVLVMGFWGAVALWRWGRRWPAQVLASLLALVWVLQGLVVNPLITDSSSGRGLMREVGRRLGPDVELGLVAWKEQNLLMADRPVANFGFLRPWPEQLRARSRPPCIPAREGFRLVAATVSQPARALNDSQRRSLARVRRDTLLTSLANA